MKSVLFFVLLLTCSASVGETIAVYYTGMRLLEKCEPNFSNDIVNTASKSACASYLAGVADFHSGAVNANVINRMWCLGETTSAPQLRLVFVKYLKAHPEKLHFEGASLVVAALGEAFPCD